MSSEQWVVSGGNQKAHSLKSVHTHPPVFFVRVANTGVNLDIARKSGKYET